MSAANYPNSGEASRPFDKSRDGFVLGEGAGVIILEDLIHAQERGANIIAEIVSVAFTSDGNHLTSPSSEGAYRAMKIALSKALKSIPSIGGNRIIIQ